MRYIALEEIDSLIKHNIINVFSISSRLWGKYVLSLLSSIETTVRVELQEKFRLMLDGWFHNFIHCVAHICVYLHLGEFKETLNACAPLLQRVGLSAQLQNNFIFESLSICA